MPSAWRKGNRKTRRSVNAVSIAQSENVFGAPGRPDGAGRHASVASAESHSVTSPRWTKACSYADQFPTRYFALYFGWTFDLMSRSCTRSGHRGQRAYSCLVAADGLCTNATQRHVPRRLITDKLLSYPAAHHTMMPSVVHCTDQYANNRAEVSHQPTRQRERQMRRFKSAAQLQRFASVHGIVQNLFRVGRHLLRAAHHRLLRTRAFVEWDAVTCAC